MRAPLKLDQLHVFVTVQDEGSFSAAARRLGRAQSAVTYAIQELEDGLRVELFDRSGYRPVLNDAGRALLARARRVLREAGALQDQAESVAGGLEPSISLVVDAIFPPANLTDALLAFKDLFPTVATRVHGESLGAAADMVVGGDADLGLLNALFAPAGQLELRPAASVELVHVCAPGHPLAAAESTASQPIPADDVQDHLQLVLSDRSPRTRDQDHGVWSTSTWRLADLGAKHAMLRAGLGWGSLPLHLAADDLAAGRLIKLHVGRPSDSTGRVLLEMSVARRPDRVLGPAGRWLQERLARGLT